VYDVMISRGIGTELCAIACWFSTAGIQASCVERRSVYCSAINQKGRGSNSERFIEV